MNSSSSPRKINYSHALLVVGLVLSLFVIMFRPAGADADLPKTVDVFTKWDEDTPSSVRVDNVLPITRKYKVAFGKSKTGTELSLTGVRLTDLLDQVKADTENVNFVKVRYGTTNDGAISIIPIGPQYAESPPIIIDKGSRPGFGPLTVPAIVPGYDGTTPIHESEMIPFRAGKNIAPISIAPGKANAKVLNVEVVRRDASKGQFKFTASIKNGVKDAPRKIRWFETTEAGKIIDHGVSESYTTDNAKTKTGPANHLIRAVVIETVSGSTGTAVNSFRSTKSSKGAKKNPYPGSTQSTGSTGTAGGSPGGSGGSGGGSSSNLQNYGGFQPSPSTGQPNSSSQIPPQTQPTESTSAVSPAIDTTAITNTAQNVSGSGGLKTVTGVLLSSPTTAPAADNGGTGSALSALPAPVATQLNSIFQPVESADDLWAYLLAILFAFSISGAVREWVNP